MAASVTVYSLRLPPSVAESGIDRNTEPFSEGERFRIVERSVSGKGWIMLKYVFPDGTFQRVRFKESGYSDEGARLTGNALADNAELRRSP